MSCMTNMSSSSSSLSGQNSSAFTTLTAVLLPPVSSSERTMIDRIMKLPDNRKEVNFRPCCNRNVKLATMLLHIVKETSMAILSSRYTQFDALVKNFGCQITALEVNQLMRNLNLQIEAKAMLKTVDKKLESLELFKELDEIFKGSVLAAPGMALEDYLTHHIGVNISVSSEMGRLIRFRMLTIINANKLTMIGKKEVETPETNCKGLLQLMPGRVSDRETLINLLVSGMQSDESFKAAEFVRGEARNLLNSQASEERKRLLNRMMNLQKETSERGFRSRIVSVSLTYNMEVCLRRMVGIILIKNKLDRKLSSGIIPIIGAKPQKVYLQMPEERILTKEEEGQLKSEEPLMVIEGYIPNTICLAEKIREIGLMTIVHANTLPLQQYASGCSQDPIEDKEALQDMVNLATMATACKMEEVIEIDHVYCASVKEER